MDINKKIARESDLLLSLWAEEVLRPIPELNYPNQTTVYFGEKTGDMLKRLRVQVKKEMKIRADRIKQWKLKVKEGINVEYYQTLIDRAENDLHWISNKQSRSRPKPHMINYMGSDNLKIMNAIYSSMPIEWQQLIQEKYFYGCKTDKELSERIKKDKFYISRVFSRIYTYIAGAFKIDLSDLYSQRKVNY